MKTHRKYFSAYIMIVILAIILLVVFAWKSRSQNSGDVGWMPWDVSRLPPKSQVNAPLQNDAEVPLLCYQRDNSDPERKAALAALEKLSVVHVDKRIALSLDGNATLVLQETKSWPKNTWERLGFSDCLDLGSTFNDASPVRIISVSFRGKDIVISKSIFGEDGDLIPVLTSAEVSNASSLQISVHTNNVFDKWSYQVDLKTGVVVQK